MGDGIGASSGIHPHHASERPPAPRNVSGPKALLREVVEDMSGLRPNGAVEIDKVRPWPSGAMAQIRGEPGKDPAGRQQPAPTKGW